MSVEKFIERLLEGELLDEPTVIDLCEKVKEQLFFEGNIVPLQSPVTVVSNIHGQLSDLLEIFRVCGSIPDVNYLFMGDMSDYGYWGIETICLLFCYRLRYPNRVTLLRGEHESRAMTKIYGLYLECLRKYGNETVWRALTDTFDYLPISATVDNRAFVVHGGIPQDCLMMDKIRVMDRFTEIPQYGSFNHLIWNDPGEDPRPSPRGSGELFGMTTAYKFCSLNKVDRIIRGHQLCMQGCQSHFGGLVITIWSAPNFLGRCGNAGAALEISDSFAYTVPTLEASYAAGEIKPQKDAKMPAINSFQINTFLAAPRSLQIVPEPSPEVEIPRGIPEYFQ